MGSVQSEQKSYEMPPREGIGIAHFLTVADIERSARYYEKVSSGSERRTPLRVAVCRRAQFAGGRVRA
jgi:hypothetical protein